MTLDSQEENPGVGGLQGKRRQVRVYQKVGTATGRDGAVWMAGSQAPHHHLFLLGAPS